MTLSKRAVDWNRRGQPPPSLSPVVVVSIVVVFIVVVVVVVVIVVVVNFVVVVVVVVVRHHRPLSLPVLLPPPMPLFPPPSPLPPLPLSGCVRRAGRSSGTATPVIRDGPDGRSTKTRYGTASAAASAAKEEEECDGCDGADPRRRLDDSLLHLADGILLRSIVATTAGAAATAVGSTAIATMSMPVIDIGALFIGREDREGDDGSGVATEDDDDTVTEAGGYARLGRAFREEEDNNKDGDEQG